MAIGLESATTTAISMLDAAYAANPTGDVSAMETTVLNWVVGEFMSSNSDVLALAADSDDPTIMVTDSTVFTTMVSNATAYLQAALDAEAATLTGGGGS